VDKDEAVSVERCVIFRSQRLGRASLASMEQKTYTKKPAAADRPSTLSEMAREGYRLSGTGEVRGVTACVSCGHAFFFLSIAGASLALFRPVARAAARYAGAQR
jgi:hypothetical protein